MEADEITAAWSFLGGPLHALGSRLGLIRGRTNTIRLGVALALLAWGVLALLTLLQGVSQKVFAIAAMGAHVRLLVAIPLFFLCETWVAPRMEEFVRHLVHFGLLPEVALPVLAAHVRRVARLSNAWLAEALFLAVALALPLLSTIMDLPGRTSNLRSLLAVNGGRAGPVLIWQLLFCLPLFRFLVLRWIWRLGLWVYLLWCVRQLPLRLVPTHPDHAAGLGYLEVVQEHFTPLVFAISSVLAASFAEEISAGTITFETLYRLLPLLLLVMGGLFMGPLFLFSSKLWHCRITGWGEYMGMASRYVDAFDRRWIRDDKVTGESQLGTADLQSLADLTNSVNVVRELQVIPSSSRLVIQLAVATLLPLLPLLCFKYPIDQLALKLFETVTGL